MNENKETLDISLSQLVRILVKRWWLIAIAVILGVLIAFGYTMFFVTPKYSASASLIVTSETYDDRPTYQDVLMGQYQVNDCLDILKSKTTLSLAAEILNNDTTVENGRVYNAANISSMLTTTSTMDSRIFSLTITSKDANETKAVADALIQAFTARLDEGELIKGGAISVVEYASVPESPSSPNYQSNILLGALIGIVIACAYIIIAGIVNNILDSEDWLIKSFEEDIPLLAVIPDADSVKNRYGYAYQAKTTTKDK